METIYIIGFYGVGKGMIGKVLASRKHLEYLDAGALVAANENTSIINVIREKGVDYYIDAEKDIIKKQARQGMVVAVSPELVSNIDALHLMKKMGRSIYLRATSDTIYNSLIDRQNDIWPFRNGFSVLEVDKQLNRYKQYFEELENYVIDVDGKSFEEILSETLAIYNYINKIKCHIYF